MLLKENRELAASVEDVTAQWHGHLKKLKNIPSEYKKKLKNIPSEYKEEVIA